MHALRRMLVLSLAAAALGFPAHPAGAQLLDQSQESSNNAHAVSQGFAVWQTFTPAVSGILDSVEISSNRFSFEPGSPTYGDLLVAVVTTAGGVPTEAELGSAVVSAETVPEGPPVWVLVDLSASQLQLAAGTSYAIRLSSPGTTTIPGHQWLFQEGGNPYADGAFFRDTDSSNGLDDPSDDLAGADAAFRTYMSLCGNGSLDDAEECDDGNLVGGDGCSASCVAEVCGDGLVLGTESCDDANALAGDGCSDVCQLERDAIGCQAAIARAGAKYAAVRLAALQRCRAHWMAGKPLAIASAAECSAEASAAGRIERAATRARRGVADGKRPKCTDTLLAVLNACTDTVDGLIAADGGSGCLITTHDAAVDALLDAQYGY